jgi:dipeptidyl aminopeptidase/acylaminoacyl peptidase
MRYSAAFLSYIMHWMVPRPGLTLLVLVVPLSLLSSISQGQLPGDPQHSSIQKLAYEAGWYADYGRGYSMVESLADAGAGSIRSTIYVRDPFESKPREIAEGEFPTWSPDGSSLAYCTRDGNFYGQIRIVNADGKGNRKLTHLKSGACFPEWSPDGKEMVITLIEGISTRLAIVDQNGTFLRELGDGRTAHWSPDGKQLVFLRPISRLKQGSSIWIMRADGSEAREILEDGSRTVQAVWLPDGEGILFTSQREGTSAAFTVGLDGKNVRKLGADPLMNWFHPVLSPDGKSLLVESATLPDANPRMVSVVQIDAATRRAKMLAAGNHFSVLWGQTVEPKAQQVEKNPPLAH